MSNEMTDIGDPGGHPQFDERELSAWHLEFWRAFLVVGWGWTDSEFEKFIADRTCELRQSPGWFYHDAPGLYLAQAVVPAPLAAVLKGRREANGQYALVALEDEILGIIESATEYYRKLDVDWTAICREVQMVIQRFTARQG
ncbi:MAG TPA: hypothetical protein VML55_01665 [Planctomycetaceae bacterium]|nr:hypothetical protein [Planctomycetaceae bacterium]